MIKDFSIVTLVVGGSGFIGRALIQRLMEIGGRRIFVLGRARQPANPLPTGVTYVQGDASDQALMFKIMEGIDEVVDLAYSTVPKTSFEDPLFDVVSNLPSSVNLLQVASQKKLQKYVLVSSGGTVYGQARCIPLDESHSTNPISPYGISKLTAEKYALFFHQMFQLPVLIARPANPYGQHQVGRTVQGFIGAAIAAIRDCRDITVYGTRGTLRDYIHIDDLAGALAAILERGRIGGIYNIGTGVGTDNLSVLDHLRRLADNDRLNIRVSHQAERRFDVGANVLDSSLLALHTDWQPRIDLTSGLQRVWSETRPR